MSKQKFDAEEAVPVALALLESLKPFCERIEIAGSLRRCKDQVGDIELLLIPKLESRQVDMFTSEPMDLAHEKLGLMLAHGELQKRPSVTGAFTWGPKNKLAIHTASGIPVDFFSTTLANWWVSLVVRTGSKETNLKLTMGAQARGARLNAYGSGVTWSDGTVTEATSEQHVFEMCGVPYQEPNSR